MMEDMVLKSRRWLVCILLAIDGYGLVAQEGTYSFAEARGHMVEVNDALKVAGADVQIAHEEQRLLYCSSLSSLSD
jgi:hypothetical protein